MNAYREQIAAAIEQLQALLGYRPDTVDVGIGQLAKDLCRVRADLAAAKQHNEDFFAAQKTVDTALRTEIDLACRERDEARAELAAERERYQKVCFEYDELTSERDKLREVLVRARPYINHTNGNTAWDLLSAIDAVLAEAKETKP